MSQTLALQLLKEIGRPARPIEVVNLAIRKGLADPQWENRGRINRDLKGLCKWHLAKENPDHTYELIPQ